MSESQQFPPPLAQLAADDSVSFQRVNLLIAGYLDGELSDAEHHELAQMIREQPEIAQRLAAELVTHAGLRLRPAALNPEEEREQEQERGITPLPQAFSTASSTQRTFPTASVILAAAAAVVTMWWVLSLAGQPPVQDNERMDQLSDLNHHEHQPVQPPERRVSFSVEGLQVAVAQRTHGAASTASNSFRFIPIRQP